MTDLGVALDKDTQVEVGLIQCPKRDLAGARWQHQINNNTVFQTSLHQPKMIHMTTTLISRSHSHDT